MVPIGHMYICDVAPFSPKMGSAVLSIRYGMFARAGLSVSKMHYSPRKHTITYTYGMTRDNADGSGRPILLPMVTFNCHVDLLYIIMSMCT